MENSIIFTLFTSIILKCNVVHHRKRMNYEVKKRREYSPKLIIATVQINLNWPLNA